MSSPSLSQLLPALRTERRYSQRALALAVGISNTQLAAYERGTAVPPEARVRQIAAVLGVSAQPLLRARRAQA